MTTRGVLSLTTCLGLLAFALGCGGPAPAQNVRKDDLQPKVRTEKISARVLTAAERATIADAEAKLTQQCMQRAGFQVFLTKPPEPVADMPYGNDDPAFARKKGLGLGDSAKIERIRASSPNTRYFQGLSQRQKDAYGQTLNGNLDHSISVKLTNGYVISANTDGCTAKAQSFLYGDFTRWFRTSSQVEQLPGANIAKVWKDRRYVTALTGWRACMRKGGFPANGPGDLRAGFEQRPDHEREWAAAALEARCSAKTGLSRIGRELEPRALSSLYKTHGALIKDYQTMSVAALTRARTILGRKG